MNLIFSALEKLFPILTENKKLALAWAVFVTAVGWVLFFAQSYPAEKAKFDRFMVEMNASFSDYPNTMLVYDVISPPILDAIQVRIYFLENFSGKYPYDSIKPEVVAQGYQKTTKVLSDIASARGVMSGVTYNIQELNDYKKGFAQDLTLMEAYLKGYEGFYLALIRGDPKEALRISANFDSSSALESINGFYVRLGNFTKTSDKGIERQRTDIKEKTNEVSIFNFKKAITWFAVIYIVIFIPSAVIYHRRIQHAFKGKKIQKRDMAQGKPKSSNKKQISTPK